MGGSCSCERNCGDGGTVRQGSRLFQKKKTMSDTSVSTRTDKLKDESSSIRYTTQFMVPGQEGDEGLQEISSGGDLGAMKINNGNETPYLSVRTSPFAIDHEHRTQTRTQTQTQTRTTEFGSNGDYSTFVEAVKWRRGQMLGKGAFGSVWLALREKDGTFMAVKTLPLEKMDASEGAKRHDSLEQDMNFMSKLQTETELHIFMEYIPGGSLEALYQKFGPLTEEMSAIYLEQILSGLNYLHSHGIIHMDIKAANVLVNTNGLCKLTDFGACCSIHKQNKSPSCVTTYWAAPEVLRGESPTAAAARATDIRKLSSDRKKTRKTTTTRRDDEQQQICSRTNPSSPCIPLPKTFINKLFSNSNELSSSDGAAAVPMQNVITRNCASSAPTHSIITSCNNSFGNDDTENRTAGGDACSIHSGTATSQLSQALTIVDDVSSAGGTEFVEWCDDASAVTAVNHYAGKIQGKDEFHRKENTSSGRDKALSHINIQVFGIQPDLTAQATFLTGKGPKYHGITANGWYDKDYHEVINWHQSAGCVKAKRVWDDLKVNGILSGCALLKSEFASDPAATVFVNGWWHGMHDPAIDYFINVRPQYLQNGGKKADVYTKPATLRDELQHELGTFPLEKFWGPTTGIASSKWFADSSKSVDLRFDPTLTFIYVPHMDYCLQKFGPFDTNCVRNDLKEIDRLLGDLVLFYEGRGARVIILSEYGISQVDRAVYLNRILRQSGYLQLRRECGGMTLDCGECRAFALCDHQVAHIHIRSAEDAINVKKLLENVPGVEKVLSGKELNTMYSDAGHGDQPSAHHPARSGDLVAIAEPRRAANVGAVVPFLTLNPMMEDDEAPDFARCVAIHRKPGYDPAEMYFRFPHPWGFLYLLLKVLLVYVFHIRTTVDATPLRCDSIRGSHGRMDVPESELPILMMRNVTPTAVQCAEDIRNLILKHLVVTTK